MSEEKALSSMNCPKCGNSMKLLDDKAQRYYCHKDDVIYIGSEKRWIGIGEEPAPVQTPRIKLHKEILGVVVVYQGAGFGKVALFFTTDKIIVAKLLGSGTDLGASLVGGVIGGAIVNVRAQNKIIELMAMSPGFILADNRDNYAIPYSEIIQIRMKKPVWSKMWGAKKSYVKIKATSGPARLEQTFKLFPKSKADFKFVQNLPSTLRDKIVMEN